MLIDDMSGVILPAAIGAAVAGTIVWQLLRNKNNKPATKATVSPDRRHPETGHPVPNEHPAVGAVEKHDAVHAFDAGVVKRPTMFAVTTDEGQAASAMLFMQRAFKIDREFWHPLSVGKAQKKLLEPLFEQVCKLAWLPGSQFERHIYAVSFCPKVEAAFKLGHTAEFDCAGDRLRLCSIDETGTQLGGPMSLQPDRDGRLPCLGDLWDALNPTGKPHALESELQIELNVLQEHVTELSRHVSAKTTAVWNERLERVMALVEDVCHKAQTEAEIQACHMRGADLSEEVQADASRIDEAIKTQAQAITTVEEADQAWQLVIAYMYARELVVRVRRVCALLHVIGGDRFENEIRCVNDISSDVKAFPDVRSLIDAATHLAHDLLSHDSRGLNEIEVVRAGEVTRHARELNELHDLYLEQLIGSAHRLQEQIDRCLMWQTHSRRYAVRVDDDGTLEELFVLYA